MTSAPKTSARLAESTRLRPFAPKDRSWLVAEHQKAYTRDEGFDQSFGPLVAQVLQDFEQDHDPDCEAGWIAEGVPKGATKPQRLGSIFCVRLSPSAAKLRLFFLLPEARGLGLGKALLTQCMGFAEGAGYSEMQLWTHESHEAACALYRSFGWRCVSSKPVHSFGVDLVEQSWQVNL